MTSGIHLYFREEVATRIADEAMVRFCTEDYQKPSKENMHKVLGHLTNFSLNKMSDKFVNSQEIED